MHIDLSDTTDPLEEAADKLAHENTRHTKTFGIVCVSILPSRPIISCDQVYDNHFESTGIGSVKAMQEPQGIVCANTCEDGNCDTVG